MASSQPVVLSGDLDILGAPTVRQALDNLQGPGVVDMRDVRYLESSTLSELARLARRIGSRKVTPHRGIGERTEGDGHRGAREVIHDRRVLRSMIGTHD